MFLVLFGGIFSDQGIARSTIIEVGSVPLIDQAPPRARAAVDEVLTLTHSDNRAAALESVRTGDVDGAVEEHGDRVVLHFSAADPVAGHRTRHVPVDRRRGQPRRTHQPPKFALTTAQVEDESLQTIQFVTPGLLGWAIATGATFGAAAAVVSWRRRGLLRRLRLAPVRTESLVAARVGVSLGVAMLQMLTFVGLAMAAFGLQLNGSWYMVVPLLVCGTLAFMSIGLLAGSVAKTEEGATSLANFVVLPMAFLSGSFFSLDHAPVWLKTVSNLLPLKHLNDGMLDVMVRGQGPSAAVKPMVILLGFALVVTLIAARLFQWEAD